MPPSLDALADRAVRFRDLHRPGAAFVMPNPWDIATARLLAGLGFNALATTSAGLAFSRGMRDGAGDLDLDAALAHAAEIVSATDLPVSADLENGYADAPEAVAAAIARCVSVGLAGASIEDVRPDRAAPVYAFDDAVARIAAAVEAARAAPRPFTLTARADGLLSKAYDLDETVRRLQAFEAAGADVLYAPGLPDRAAVERVCAAVSKPVNHVIGLGAPGLSIADLAAAGVARVSLGGTLSRVALGAVFEAGRALRDGRADIAESGASWGDILGAIKAGRPA